MSETVEIHNSEANTSTDVAPVPPSEQERILAIVRRVLVEGPIPHSLHSACAEIEKAVLGG